MTEKPKFGGNLCNLEVEFMTTSFGGSKNRKNLKF